ncbi:MAG: DegT/DnrJ/EryC1/StrS family aminotransferase [Alphaproteobacteria bacterium]|uniref:DegT/DnrJ/EryC1/StrS family aminotransferase n=1 Tax=Candidatus Nitrobium versatile TaxID=2884831 RepID=A0A953J796_9BACT|nr:DegT/DnrJ/EryC1/StrS family aminotransferase [Candidatus Nitrobium versatile]
MKIEFFRHNIGKEDIDRTVEVLHSIFLTTGSVVGELESGLAAYLDVPYAIGVTSCTAALHLCLLAWGIGPGDEVITTPLSFCATANSILHAGARPVFVDVEETTGNIDAALIEPAVTERTKAIMPVHLYGQMCDMKEIRRIADKYNLVVIEDAAHCIEGVRDGIKVGRLGDAACFSFYATKNITSGEGGAITVHDTGKDELLRMLRLHGIDKSAADRYTKKYRHWDMPVLGWKYNMDNIQAALLVGQLKRIDELWERRDALYRRYEDALSPVKGITLTGTVPGSRHACHLFTIRVAGQVAGKERDSVLLELQESGVGVAVNYRPIHLLEYYRKYFGYKEGDFPIAEKIGGETISLPLYPLLRDEEAEYVIRAVMEAVTS